jgi:GNAT superfamily N-acetyltransferase
MDTYIKKIESKADIIAFHELPFKIYQKDSNWTPPTIQEVEAVFDPKKNKYFTHGCCERWILLNEKSEIIGRIAAFINEKKAHTFKQPTGGIGFFECINDETAANKLFEQSKSWLSEKGIEAMDGPINFGENNKFWGLLIENFDFPTYYGQNYNPAYYKILFEQYGFQVYYYQLINYRKINDPIPEKFKQKAEAIINDPSFRIETLKINQIEKYAEDFRTVYNAAWVTHDNFKEMSKDMANSLFKKMKPIIDEDLFCFVYHENKPSAFCLCIPDISPIFKRLNGNLNWIGKLKFLVLKYFVKTPRINGVAIGVHPDFQKKGIEGAIFMDLGKRLQRQSKYKDIVVTWVGDFNPKMQFIFEDIGFTVKSKMATYRKLFDDNAVFERSPIIEKK